MSNQWDGVIVLAESGLAPNGPAQLSGTFANKPLASAVPIGTEYFATDAGIGGSLWRSNGTAWKSVSKSLPLLSYVNEAGFVAAANSVEQIFSDVILIPGGLVESGDKLQWVGYSEDTGTPTAHLRMLRIRVHSTASIMSGATANGVGLANTNVNRFLQDKSSMVHGDTTRYGNSSAFGGVATTSVSGAEAIDWTTDKYAGFTVANANTLVAHTVYFGLLYLEKGS